MKDVPHAGCLQSKWNSSYLPPTAQFDIKNYQAVPKQTTFIWIWSVIKAFSYYCCPDSKSSLIKLCLLLPLFGHFSTICVNCPSLCGYFMYVFDHVCLFSVVFQQFVMILFVFLVVFLSLSDCFVSLCGQFVYFNWALWPSNKEH